MGPPPRPPRRIQVDTAIAEAMSPPPLSAHTASHSLSSIQMFSPPAQRISLEESAEPSGAAVSRTQSLRNQARHSQSVSLGRSSSLRDASEVSLKFIGTADARMVILASVTSLRHHCIPPGPLCPRLHLHLPLPLSPLSSSVVVQATFDAINRWDMAIIARGTAQNTCRQTRETTPCDEETRSHTSRIHHPPVPSVPRCGRFKQETAAGRISISYPTTLRVFR